MLWLEYLKLELNGLEGGGGLDAPDATVFGDVHNLMIIEDEDRACYDDCDDNIDAAYMILAKDVIMMMMMLGCC